MNEKITIQDFIDLLCEKQGMERKDAELFIKGMFELIEEVLATEKYVKIKCLGTFKLTEVDARESVNVNTGERIEIQGHTKVSFTPDTTMKELINKPFSHFETVVLNDGVELEDTASEEVKAPEIKLPTDVTPIVEVQEVLTTEEPVVVEETIAVEPFVEEQTSEATMMEVSEVSEEVVHVESVDEKIIIEEPQPELKEPQKVEKPEFTEEKKSSHFLWGIIVVLVLIILFGVYWMFLRPADSTESIPVVPVNEEVVVASMDGTTQEDTLQEIISPQLVQYVKLSPEELLKERVPSLADTTEYRIVGTQSEYTLQNGETIIKASVKFFGTKKYWPYIVKHNMDVIQNPDNIPAGIQIKIPNLTLKD